MQNVNMAVDVNESNSMARVKIIVDDNTSKLLTSVNTVSDDIKRNSTVNAMADQEQLHGECQHCG